LKDSKLTVWDRNLQLATYSAVIYLGVHLYNTGSLNILAGWTYITIAVSLLGAIGGILVALCLKYLDSIVKSLATTGNTALSMGLGYLLMNDPLSPQKVIGAVLVILSIFIYNDNPQVGTESNAAKEKKEGA
jgi:UDP-sugar transporter A1/2/3